METAVLVEDSGVLSPRRSIQEVRIDFLLEEEFSCDLDFLTAFVHRCDLTCSPTSVIEVRHESQYGPAWIDVIVIFQAALENGHYIRVGLLIEDKITAGPQPDQAARYKEAGTIGTGKFWDVFRTVLVAPKSYYGERGLFQAFVSLEDIADLLSTIDPVRATFRRRKISEAIEKKNKTGVQIPDLKMTAFKNRYYEYLNKFNEERGTDFSMDKPKDRHYSGDTWCMFSSNSFPKWLEFRHRIRISIKAKTGIIELGFKNVNFAMVDKALEDIVDVDMRVLANGSRKQHVAIEIPVPEIAGTPEFDVAAPVVRLALEHAGRLLAHVRQNWPALEPILLAARDNQSAIVKSG